MRLNAIKVGDFVSRECWIGQTNSKRYGYSCDSLSVTKLPNGEYWYCEKFIPKKQLRKDSSGYTRSDFVIVKGFEKMKYTNNVIVTNDKDGQCKDFDTEDLALDYIQACMDTGSMANYKIFQATTLVEPKRVDVMAILRKIS